MEDTALLLENVEKTMAGFTEKLDAIAGRVALIPDKVETSAELHEDADLEQRAAVKSITDMEVWDIPIGKAVIGGFIAVIGSELIDGFMLNQSNTTKGLIKLVVAGATVKWGKRFLGSAGAGAVALLLAYDGVRQLLPLDEWANKAAKTLTGVIPGAGLAGKAGMTNIGATVPLVLNTGGGGSFYPGIAQRVG